VWQSYFGLGGLNMVYKMKDFLEQKIAEIKSDGLYKEERIISSKQAKKIKLSDGKEVLNFCANNYLGLSSEEFVCDAAIKGIEEWGYGLSSVRFICGTQKIHKELESKVSDFLGTEDTILYSSCFDANGGLFETLLTAEDAIVSDALNHASIIDGVRLCKAQRFRYENNNMQDLEAKLKEASDARHKVIVTDGVFSMDGVIANLKGVCDLADKYNALVVVDDSHGVGVIGKTGKGAHEYNDVMGRVDILTGTFGKALGGASGGYTSGRKEIIDLLRQRSRPYLFSNSIAPAVAASTIAVLDSLMNSNDRQDRLRENTKYFREKMKAGGFDISKGDHPIVPLMLGDAVLAHKIAGALLEEGVYVIGFAYPVVPKGKARIRVQISAAFSKEDLDYAVEKFCKVKGSI
jgi:glycine C-acetyltransferase